MAEPATPSNPTWVTELYPDGSVPEDRFDTMSALCSMGHSQLLLTGAIRQVLTQHFADADQIISPTLRRKLTHNGAWNAGPTTGLYVEGIARWRPELTEARPAIIIKEGEWTWKRLGVGDNMGEDWRDGKRHFGGLWVGTHTLFALGNEGAETQILAHEMAKTLLWYGPVILEAFDLHRFVVVSIGALAALKESTENYVVPVNVAYALSETWQLQPDAPRLKRIEFTASETLGYGG